MTMLIYITTAQRYEMISTSLAIFQETVAFAPHIADRIISAWAREVGPAKTAVLSSIAYLSIRQGTCAVEVSAQSLAQGLGMTARTARTLLTDLAERDYINLYRVKTSREVKENQENIVEIRPEKLVATDQSSEFLLGKFFLAHYDYIKRYCVSHKFSHRLGKPSQLPTAGLRPPWQAGFSDRQGIDEIDFTPRVETGEGIMLAIPKKPRPRPAPLPESAAEAIAAVQTKHAKVQAARASKVTSTSSVDTLRKENLQALIDKAMKEFLPSLPRVIVTIKPLGLMKRRMADAGMADVPAFITWAIRSWATLAEQNRNTYLKDPSRIHKGTPLPAAPSFSALAYKFPYFLAAYRNKLSARGSSAIDGKSFEQKQIERLQSQLRTAQEENAALRRSQQQRREHNAVLHPSAPPPAARRRIQATLQESTADLGDDNDLPEWAEGAQPHSHRQLHRARKA